MKIVDEKIENLLNVSLDVSQEEREKSEILSVGFLPGEQLREVILKYNGNLDNVRALSGRIRIFELLLSYAVVLLPEELVEAVSALENVLYVEMPKRLYFSVNQGRSASCVNSLQQGAGALTGAGVLIGIVDSGIDISHQDFRNEDGSSRILRFWDQDGDGNPPENYPLGTEYSQEEITQLLQEGNRLNTDPTGHGTAVAGIAAGNGRESAGKNRGMAPGCGIMVVKMGISRESSFPRTTQLMLGVDYLVRQSLERNQPMAINLSFGYNYGSHSGRSLLETYLSDVADLGRLAICVGSGNEAASPIHTVVQVPSAGNSSQQPGRNPVLSSGSRQIWEIPFAVSMFETGLNLQLWKYYPDQCTLTLIHPSGQEIPVNPEVMTTVRYQMGGTQILAYYGQPVPYLIYQEIFFDFLPEDSYLDSGVWKLRLEPTRTVHGLYQFWLPDSASLNPGTGFLYPEPDQTLTIPSTAETVVTVGAYDSRRLSYADFSGRGYTGFTRQLKPDLVAPGVDITTTRSGGGYETVTGTSFATPFVTGAAALMMEWGIIRGNDPFMYGQRLKACLHRGATQITAGIEYPNNWLGYGALCVRDSLIN